MRIVVDGAPWSVELAEDATMEEAFREVVQQLATRRRWIVSTSLDGRPLAGEGHAQVKARRCAEFVCLEVATKPAREVMLPLLDSVAQLLVRLRESQRRAGDEIALAKGRAGLKSLLECLVGWRTLTQFLAEVSRAASSPLTGLKIPAEAMQDRVSKLNQTLTDLKGALEVQDLALAGDVMTHDLVEHLDYWDRFVRDLRASAEKELQPPP